MQIGTFRRNVAKTLTVKATKMALRRWPRTRRGPISHRPPWR